MIHTSEQILLNLISPVLGGAVLIRKGFNEKLQRQWILFNYDWLIFIRKEEFVSGLVWDLEEAKDINLIMECLIKV